MPTKNKRVATIDLMRYDFEKAPEGIMDYLFVKLFQYFQAEGKQYFDMGMAPLANVVLKKIASWKRRLPIWSMSLHSVFTLLVGSNVIRKSSLQIWSPKYIVYPKRTWLLFDMIAILRIDNRKIEDRLKKRTSLEIDIKNSENPRVSLFCYVLKLFLKFCF